MAVELIQIKDDNFPKTSVIDGAGLEYIVVSKADGITYAMLTSDFKAFLGTVQTISPKALSPSDPAPTLAGVYLPTEDGIYANAGGLVADSSLGINQFVFDGVSEWVRTTTPINLTGYLSKEEIEQIYGYQVSTGEYIIADETGKIAFMIDKDGKIEFSHLGIQTLDRLRNDLGVVPGIIVKKVNGKSISIMGDSISTDNGGGNAGLVYPEQYWGRLQDLQECQIYRTAIGNTTIAESSTSSPFTDPSRWQSVNSVFEPDIILIFGGINDFLQNVALGVPTDTTVTTFYGALDYLYRSLLARCPMARLFHITPLHTTLGTGGGLIPEFNGQNFLSEYIEAIESVARRYGVGVIDANRDTGITCFNIDILSDDEIHVKQQGHEMIYNLIVSAMEYYL